MPFRTYVHIAALAAAVTALFSNLAPAAEPTITIPRNPMVIAFPQAGEWNCSDQVKTHWCHRKPKAAKKRAPR